MNKDNFDRTTEVIDWKVEVLKDTMLKRQDEVIVERDHKVIELEEEIKRLKSFGEKS